MFIVHLLLCNIKAQGCSVHGRDGHRGGGRSYWHQWPSFEGVVITVHISGKLLKRTLPQFPTYKIGVALVFIS